MSGLYDVHGKKFYEGRAAGLSTNFAVWWDGDLLRELLDRNRIDKWNWQTQSVRHRCSLADCCSSNNGTKATPALSADLWGDWREEVIWRTRDNRELRIYTSTIPTPHRLTTLMQDAQYRLAIAWQNVAYNQPPHPSFYLDESAPLPKRPEDKVRGRVTSVTAPGRPKSSAGRRSAGTARPRRRQHLAKRQPGQRLESRHGIAPRSGSRPRRWCGPCR